MRAWRPLLSAIGVIGTAYLVLDGARRELPPGRASAPARTPNGWAPHDQAGADSQADSPAEIPAPGWRETLKRTAKKFSDNQLMSQAAGVTFYALLAIFPAITAVVSIYGLFADPASIKSHVDMLGTLLPSGGMEIITDQINRLTQNPPGRLGLGAVLGILAAVWSANQGSKAMFSALNVVYGEREQRGFITLTAVSLAMTAGAIVFLLVGLGAVVLVPLLLERFGLSGVFDATASLLRWPLIVLVLTLMLSVLYRFGPSRPLAAWRWVTWGGAVAAIAWVILSIAFSWYVAHFGSYNKTYGSLGAAIGFMTWIWLSGTVVLLGGQLNAELEMQAGDGPTGRKFSRPETVRGA